MSRNDTRKLGGLYKNASNYEKV